MVGTPIGREQRFTKANPCPICGGHDALPHGQGIRCFGFLSTDGEYAHCTREDLSGGIKPDPNGTSYPHRLHGLCRCGMAHGGAEPVRLEAVREGKRREVARYSYKDESGAELYHVRRFDPKDFRPYLPGASSPSLGDVRRVPYRLPEIGAANAGDWVLVVEGEKDADALAALGFVATTSQGGAGQARQWLGAEFVRPLADRAVVVLPDNDGDGRRFASTVAEGLRGVARAVRIIALPNLPPKGDPYDWLANGGTAEALIALIEGGQASEPIAQAIDYPPTDTGNANLFAATFGDQLRYDHRRGLWVRWGGHWWEPDDDGQAMRHTETIAAMRLDAAGAIEDKDERKQAIRWGLLSQSRSRREACLSIAGVTKPLAVSGAGWDTDPFLMGVANGVVDLRTGGRRDGRADDAITLHSPVAHDPDADAPRWRQFLREVFREHDDVITWVQRFAGYSLTGEIGEHALVLCFGTGSNGKSTFLNTLSHIMGDYAYVTPFSVLERNERDSAVTNDLAALVGRRLVTASETNEGRQFNEARVKALTGGDPITARFLHKEFFTFRPVMKLWLAVNHKPVVRDDSRGFWRRFRMLPFLASFDGDRADRILDQTLRAEAAGILNWAIEGCVAWQTFGLQTPTIVAEATAEYERESDPIGPFLAQACTVNEAMAIRANEFYLAYGEWAGEQGLAGKEILTRTLFGRRMGERFKKIEDRQGTTYKGVSLTDEWRERKRSPR